MSVPNLKRTFTSRVAFMAVVMTLLITTVANSQTPQYPLMEKIAGKVIAQYQGMSCAQLEQKKKTPPSGQEAEMMAKAIVQLKQDPAMRTAFINKVAAPIANKMFDCGLIP